MLLNTRRIVIFVKSLSFSVLKFCIHWKKAKKAFWPVF